MNAMNVSAPGASQTSLAKTEKPEAKQQREVVAVETPKAIVAPQELRFSALDQNNDGALNIREMSRMAPQLPPDNVDPADVVAYAKGVEPRPRETTARDRLLEAVKTVSPPPAPPAQDADAPEE